MKKLCSLLFLDLGRNVESASKKRLILINYFFRFLPFILKMCCLARLYLVVYIPTIGVPFLSHWFDWFSIRWIIAIIITSTSFTIRHWFFIISSGSFSVHLFLLSLMTKWPLNESFILIWWPVSMLMCSLMLCLFWSCTFTTLHEHYWHYCKYLWREGLVFCGLFQNEIYGFCDRNLGIFVWPHILQL